MIVALPTTPLSSTLYVDWVLARHPGTAPAARELLGAVGRDLSVAREKPGRFLDGVAIRARRLPPAHLPWFWDTVGHRLTAAVRSPRHAARAYGEARKAERVHALAVDADFHRANTLLFARAGALPAAELTAYQRWLAAGFPPKEAHEEYVRLLTVWAASPGDLPADLARRVRASARSAGLGADEDARVLGAVLARASGKALPDALLGAATAVLAEHPQGDEVNAALVALFPTSRNDAASWLRLLAGSGATEAMADGRIVPDGGPAAWLGRYAGDYAFRPAGGGIMRQPMPPELFELVTRLAPRLRAAGVPVSMHRTKWQYTGLDADLLDACLAEGIPVEDPGGRVGLRFWGDRSRRDLKALAEDPVFGPRLEGTVHEELLRGPFSGPRAAGTAITRLPENSGIAAEVHRRVNRLLDALRGGGLGAADEAVRELAALLDRPTATALDGIEEALAALDLVGPLARSLRAGLPDELGWPALDDVLADFARCGDQVAGVTCTWPVLTVYSRTRAVAVDHAGRRADRAFSVPDDATTHSAHFAGGHFLVGWTTTGAGYAEHAFWTDRPEDVFAPENVLGIIPFGGSIKGGLGFHFETADGGGRHDGERVLRPGSREGIGGFDLQMSDGHRLWSSDTYSEGWARLDPATGARTRDTTLPAFHTSGGTPPGTALFARASTLAALPPGAPASPLGQEGRLAGCRVFHRTDHRTPAPTEFVLQGIDGRGATYRVSEQGQEPWGIVRMPEGGEDGVLAEEASIRCHAREDGSLLWEVHGFPAPNAPRHRATRRGHAGGPFPPPAFWHFLAPRHAASSAALRALTEEDARALLADPEQVPPGVSDARIAASVRRAARLAADVLRRREELSRRVGIMRSGPAVHLPVQVPDTELVPALWGLLPESRAHSDRRAPQPYPATLTSVAADGAFLRGALDDETRRLAPPTPPYDWSVLLGHIDAAAWRAAVHTTGDRDRAALTALLEIWAQQPFAVRGSAWRTGRAPAVSSTGPGSPSGAPGRAGAAENPDLRAAVSGPPNWAGTVRFVQPADAPAPAGTIPAEEVTNRDRASAPHTVTVTVTRDDASRLTRFLALLAEHGPLPVAPEAVLAFCRRTGARRSLATLVLAGLPRPMGYEERKKLLRSAPYRADKDAASVYDGLPHTIGPAGTAAILAAGVPDDPADLWADGGGVRAAERMADEWNRLIGRRPYADEDLAVALETELGLDIAWARRLSAPPAPAPAHGPGSSLPVHEPGPVPAPDPVAAGDEEAVAVPEPDSAAPRFVLAGGSTGGLSLHHTRDDGRPGDVVRSSDLPFTRPATLLAWLLTERPVGDPARAHVRALHAEVLRTLHDPGMLVPAGRHPEPARTAPADPAFAPYAGPVLPCTWSAHGRDNPPVVYDDGCVVVAVPGQEVFLRPSGLATRRESAWADRAARRIEVLYAEEGGLARMVGRAERTPVPAGAYEANPRHSVPGLTAEVADTLAVGPDAAALYLQLLALARPTDRNVRRWNGWPPARHKKAQAELVAVGAVDTGQRPRAGRTAFVPGPWTELATPHLPLEAAKPAAYGATTDGGVVQGPFSRLLPPLPLHELFAGAWTEAAARR
ncbi:hypothetical protein [Streptomyces lavendofoliae]|uniref:DNA-binding protein n=1 Tax=Streptomyces lavendofoliae TaxID=67314 RepID=A0A918I1M5_9ACTN|nr:hypothetical protein [Streptomyces lavendofoliae]GGU49088.1 hypothetical protein GCM10010274_41980 [Streptomyces lavendofoliae]